MEVTQNFVWKTALFLFVIFGACIGPKEKNSAENSEIVKSEPCFVKQELVSSDEKTFDYKDLSFEIKQSDTLPSVLKINNLEYPINIELESPSVKFWYYKCGEKAVFLIEGDDYYGSTFFAYYLINEELYYLGNLSVLQPNVESEGILKKDFNVSFNDSQFEVVSFLKGEIYETVIFKEMHRIQHD